ncbi:MAG TPA: glycerol-3-phosphate 1-O-acyltransferase PlsY [Ktedonobacterales bacterium]|nr:glycerol-3-phosphate 1-O-acyltransferase PlsY [Ktedonobacterales bacterium]
MSAIEVVLRMGGAALAGYLLGSIPFGVLAGRFFGDRDPRAFGSGKTGATNVLRTLGKGPAAFVVAGDVAKGAAAVLLARFVFFGGHSDPATLQATAEAVAGFCAILGHNYSVLIGFKGGRGVLTGAGAMIVMTPFTFLIGLICAVVPIAITRYVSLGSILGAASSIIVELILLLTRHDSLPHFIFILVGGLVIIVSHRDNIGRLIHGTERKLGQPAHPAATEGR